ncbi:hypothetical protein [Sporosarcina sp. HYO08]|uniref:hypothetical protein n=1 Tax=Sporosarcina sp. HYO08 TaxID=1759557 RepID=UPI000791FB61|nr:hypothetical protein [Sporosarcina sp. HYO08]KXH78534.1 hypothetical protein AU377_12705 [Sporosarcina sp. HYO08]
MNKEMLDTLINKVVKIDRGGPESRIGRLLAADNDHITIFHDEEGVIYYHTRHIKSLTYNSKEQAALNIEMPSDIKLIQAKEFKGVLEQLPLRWVKINRGGPETLEGVLETVTDDFVTIVANEEIIHVAMYHIRNISYGAKVEKKEQKQNKGNSKGKK